MSLDAGFLSPEQLSIGFFLDVVNTGSQKFRSLVGMAGAAGRQLGILERRGPPVA